ncbi:MaoC family dehydratase [Conexibacter stalactiti]|uniref:MaoC family dehydratase n=1 Tax=Conexibacter stalactiti TaxID=1940611 RepID=A0ABU4HNI9_9ACTN|nr:MaoC family dehydratase [Conexibacter stalactiti]MDW5594873.1 MaoC family dehydratase [Conexibacter stalactiti]MEC5035515.1 MaoC family dehydratase [Conexibacter stalactiti]
MRTFNGIDELRAAAGEEIGISAWHAVTQAEIDAFAEVTGDRQWIHVDRERAASSPFGATIAHGLLTLSLGPRLLEEVLTVEGVAFGVNYGYGKVRFPSPVPAGSLVRMRATLLAVEEVAGGVQATIEQRFEREGSDKPVCVAESLGRFYAAAP